MKRVIPCFLAALLLILSACRAAPESPSQEVSDPPLPSPSQSASPGEMPSPSPSPGEDANRAPAVESSAKPAPEDSRYFFMDGFFLGAWCDETWYSAHETAFTLGQLFNCAYYNRSGETVNSVHFFVGEGPGGYEDSSRISALLSPFGSIENEDLALELPARLTGSAAALNAPAYGFSARFENKLHPLISNAEVSVLPLDETADPMADDLALRLLADAGISCDLDRVWRDCWLVDYDSDGEKERLEFIRNRETDQGYASLEDGDPIFYALFLTDGGETSLVTARSIDYTTDLTAQFSLHNLTFLYDLNGDDVYEIYFQHRGWESGHCSVFSLTNSGWTEVLRANYGT